MAYPQIGQPVATSGTAHVASCTKGVAKKSAERTRDTWSSRHRRGVCACVWRRTWWRSHLRTLLGKISRRHPRKQTHPGRSCSLVCKTAVFVSLLPPPPSFKQRERRRLALKDGSSRSAQRQLDAWVFIPPHTHTHLAVRCLESGDSSVSISLDAHPQDLIRQRMHVKRSLSSTSSQTDPPLTSS